MLSEREFLQLTKEKQQTEETSPLQNLLGKKKSKENEDTTTPVQTNKLVQHLDESINDILQVNITPVLNTSLNEQLLLTDTPNNDGLGSLNEFENTLTQLTQDDLNLAFGMTESLKETRFDTTQPSTSTSLQNKDEDITQISDEENLYNETSSTKRKRRFVKRKDENKSTEEPKTTKKRATRDSALKAKERISDVTHNRVLTFGDNEDDLYGANLNNTKANTIGDDIFSDVSSPEESEEESKPPRTARKRRTSVTKKGGKKRKEKKNTESPRKKKSTTHSSPTKKLRNGWSITPEKEKNWDKESEDAIEKMRKLFAEVDKEELPKTELVDKEQELHFADIVGDTI
ncbi:hypothetical protein ABK040_008488 [Willaertia magna]